MPLALPVQFQVEDIIKLAAAILIGGLLGTERELHDKAAGLRTLILICLGSTLFTIFSVQIAGDKDPGRVAAQIVTGIGFLGAGVIIHERGRVHGLTTASTIWLTAALGIGVGIGMILYTLVATLVALFVLWVLPRFEWRIERARTSRDYRIVTDIDPQMMVGLEKLFRESGLSIKEQRRLKQNNKMTSVWQVSGRQEEHEQVITVLMADPEVLSVDY